MHQLAASQSWVGYVVGLFAQAGVFILPLALLAMWFRADPPVARMREAIVVGVVAAGLAFALGLVLERTLARPRPFVELDFAPLLPHVSDSSFPSDHTLVGVALVGPMLWGAPKPGRLLLAWALMVGVSRVFAGLHYPSDIVGSAILALAIDALVWWAIRPVLVRLRPGQWIPHA